MMLWLVLLLTTVGMVHLRATGLGNITEQTGACEPLETDLYRCIFTHLHTKEDFVIQGKEIKFLEIYFAADILHGVLPDGSFSKVPQLIGLLIHGHFPAHISSGAFKGLTKLDYLTLTRDRGDWYFEKDNRIYDTDLIPSYYFQHFLLDEVPSPTFGSGWIDPLINLTRLNLRYNNISRLESGQFCGLQFLMYLDLRNNALSSMEDIGLDCNNSNQSASVCHPCQALEYLELSNNIISELKDFGTYDSSELLRLTMRNNALSFVSKSFFQCNKQLVILDLSENKLHGHSLLAAGLGELHNLVTLLLSGNNVPAIPPTMLSKMTKLERFECNKCGIRSISNSSFAKSQNLKNLSLMFNRLNSVRRDAFKSLASLRYLLLNGNSLSQCEIDGVMPNLRNLSLNDNRLQRIPDFSASRDNLAVLYLSHNNISIIEPNRLSGLINLVEFNLAFNNISYVPDETFSRYGYSLSSVHLENNHIKFINEWAFKREARLSELHLQNNQISDITGWLMIDVPRLGHVNLSGNNLKEFDARLIPQSIKTVDLSWNQISNIKETISPLPYLRVLDLSHNKLYKLSRRSLSMMPVLVPRPQVFLEGNWLHCDCHLDWLRQINSVRNLPEVPDLDQVYCETPFPHTHSSLATIDALDMVCPYKTECVEWVCDCCHVNDKSSCECRSSCYPKCSCTHKPDHSFNSMDCSSRNISSLPSNGLSYALSISLDDNFLPDLTASKLQFPFAVELLLNKSHISHIAPGAFYNIQRIKALYLQDNNINMVDGQIFHYCKTLETLFLQNNKIRLIQDESFRMLIQAKDIRLDHNRLRNLNLTQFSALESLGVLTLNDNPWECDCQFGPHFQKWLQANAKIIHNIKGIYCKGAESQKAILDMDFAFCTERALLVELVTVVIMFVATGILVVLIHRYRLLLMVLAYNQLGIRFRRHNEDGDNGAKIYDVFLTYYSYADRDIILDEMLPNLENVPRERSYKVCTDDRDFAPYDSNIELIATAVKKSKRTILLITENYFDDYDLGQCKFQAAHHQVLTDKQLRLIIILMDKNLQSRLDIEIKLYLWSGIYLVYGEHNFWDKVRYYLADNPRGADEVVGRNLVHMELAST